jgi:hypothetical protein
MDSLIPLLIVGVFMYLIFFRRGGAGGGMGCCGSHGTHDSGRHHEPNPKEESSHIHQGQENVIDLRQDEYTILTPNNDKHPL